MTDFARLLFNEIGGTQVALNFEGDLTFSPDANFSENYSLTTEVTQKPIASGRKISDHAFLNADALSLSGMVSESPVRFVSSLRDDKTSLITGAAGDVSRSQNAFNMFESMRENKTSVEIVTRHKVFKNMMLVSFVPKVGKEQALFFDLKFIEVTIVNSETTQISASLIKDANDKARAEKKKAEGNKTSNTETPAQEDKKSLLMKGFRAIFG